MSPPHRPPTSFSLFPKLPPELRGQIWDTYDHDMNRIIKVNFDMAEDPSRGLWVRQGPRVRGNTTVPNVFLINREAFGWTSVRYSRLNTAILDGLVLDRLNLSHVFSCPLALSPLHDIFHLDDCDMTLMLAMYMAVEYGYKLKDGCAWLDIPDCTDSAPPVKRGMLCTMRRFLSLTRSLERPIAVMIHDGRMGLQDQRLRDLPAHLRHAYGAILVWALDVSELLVDPDDGSVIKTYTMVHAQNAMDYATRENPAVRRQYNAATPGYPLPEIKNVEKVDEADESENAENHDEPHEPGSMTVDQ